MDSGSITTYIVIALYYILIIPLAILSAFGIYIFIRYGKSVMFAMITSLIYIVLFIGLLATSHHLLASI